MKKMSDLANRKENVVSVILEAGQDFRKNEILANVVPEQDS